jgi:hypothetical protein
LEWGDEAIGVHLYGGFRTGGSYVRVVQNVSPQWKKIRKLLLQKLCSASPPAFQEVKITITQ